MAATNGQTLTAAGPEPVQEPSMEDILASIRRIIASDQHIAGARAVAASPKMPALQPQAPGSAALAAPSRAAPAESLPPYPGEIPNLDDLEPIVSPPAAVAPEPVDDGAAAARRETAAQLHPELFPPPADVQDVVDVYDLRPSDQLLPPPGGVGDDLISSVAREQVSSSFHLLADTVLRDPETIERIAQDTLRPMLKTWLDDNLPSMVERLVRAEIERVARGGRRG